MTVIMCSVDNNKTTVCHLAQYLEKSLTYSGTEAMKVTAIFCNHSELKIPRRIKGVGSTSEEDYAGGN